MIFENVNTELEKLKATVDEIEKSTENINRMEVDKLFLTKEQLAKLLNCSERAAGEFMNLPGFPLIKVGGTSMVNVFALNEFTQQRLVMAEMKKGG